MKKTLTVLLTLFLLAACICAAAAEGTHTFIDSTGREVEVPASIERIALSGPMAQIVLFPLAPDMFVGIAYPWDSSAGQ